MAIIKKAVKQALGDFPASAYLFGSYARGEATAKSDVDIAVIFRSTTASKTDWIEETALIRHRLEIDKSVDLILMDNLSYEKWKNEAGTVQSAVFLEGVQLV